jgi:N-acetylmuramoyl-L-alanine amidase
VKINGRDYIPGKDIKDFYAFKSYQIKGKTFTFLLDNFWMRGTIGSKELNIKGIKFILSFDVEQQGNEILFSRTDLVKLIDPVLRPDYIKGQPDFDTVVIDPGHGGHDTGARGANGLEKDFALKTSLLVAALLKARKYKVVMTRSTDTFVTLQGRAAIANKVPKAIFVSIHFNHSDNKAARGLETFALSPAGTTSTIQRWAEPNLGKRRGNMRDAENIALATAVHNGVMRRISVTKPIDRGIKRARFSVISGVTIPGILFEGGFVANAIEGKLIAHPTYQKMLAEGIVTGIENYRRALKQ